MNPMGFNFILKIFFFYGSKTSLDDGENWNILTK